MEFASLWGGSALAAWRGRGIYRALVAERARQADTRGARYLQVDASDDSRPILARLGFHAVTTTTHTSGLPDRKRKPVSSRHIFLTRMSAMTVTTLSSLEATALLGAVIIFTFVIAVLGIFAGIAAGPGAERFMVLVGILLVFVLAVLGLGVRFHGRTSATGSVAVPPPVSSLARVRALVEGGSADEADQALAVLAGAHHDGPEYWYWKARVALARGNTDVALAYADHALAREPRDEYALALKIELLVLTGKKADRTKARALARDGHGVGDRLDLWLASVEAEGLLGTGAYTARELYRQLRDFDMLGIVSFDTQVRTVLPATLRSALGGAPVFGIRGSGDSRTKR